MSCCNETTPTGKLAEKVKSFTAEEILANLPQVVKAPTDPAHPLASGLRNSLPLTAGKCYGVPKVHDDGTIEYTPIDGNPPADINGYVRDPQNPWLFRPLWTECQLCLVGCRTNPKGEMDVKMVCNNPLAAPFMKYVKPDDCFTCTKRKNPA